jgi:hypothetical protein
VDRKGKSRKTKKKIERKDRKERKEWQTEADHEFSDESLHLQQGNGIAKARSLYEFFF